MTPAIADYQGPLGGLEPELARRRIAVATDASGRVCLVRPDSVVLEFDSEAYGKVADDIEGDDGLEILGGRVEHPPRLGTLGARDLAHKAAPPDSARWGTANVVAMIDRLTSDTCRARPNQVYLADGVARQFGILGAGGSTGTPGFVNPVSLESTVRPAPSSIPRSPPRPAGAPPAQRPRPRYGAADVRRSRRAPGPRQLRHPPSVAGVGQGGPVGRRGRT